MSTLILEDHKLHYTCCQSNKKNPTLIFLHDLCMDSGMWQRMLQDTGHHFNLLTYDFYGHGKTTDCSKASSFDLLFKEFVTLLRHLDLDKVHLVGCRYSAILALEIALQIPHRVETLTFMSLPILTQNYSYDEETTNLQLLQIDRQLFLKRYLVQSVYPVTLSKARIITRALRNVLTRHIRSSIEGIMQMNDLPRSGFIEKLKQLHQPVLFMHGACDPTFPAALAMIFSHYAANSRFHACDSRSFFTDPPGPAGIRSKFAQSFYK
ncbi:alpha/beta hydrolase [Sporolactobacillus sp. THM7-4]|nr:alpha/beta hydrolase [Sporolactobacillus sp. THM7-4]